MTTMSIDNSLTQRSLQFIGIGVNKLTFKSINIIQSSNNYNIVSGFICWNQNTVHMKILDTFLSFKTSGSTFSRLHQRLLKYFKEAAISLRHLGKSILEVNLYLGPLDIIFRTLVTGMSLRLLVITCPAGGYK